MSEVAEAPVEAPAERRTSGTPVRTYIILEQQVFEEDQQSYFVVAGTVEARNAANALRKAFRQFKGANEVDATLVPIPEGMWRPTFVRGRRRDDITVSLGE